MKKTFYLTLLNVLSCFCVVMIHCNSVFWTAPAGTLWISANFIETACYFAVPVFFMVSGCTLFDYQERYSTKEYFHKRFWRTVFPFLVWSLLAYANQTRIAVRDGGTPDWNLMHIMDGILNIKYLQVYWFFIPLFSVYLSIPLLAGIKDKRSAFSYGAGMGIFFVAAMPLLSKLFHIPYNGGLTPGVVSGYLFISMLGYVLANREFGRKERICVYLLGLFGWALHFWGTDWLSGPGMIDRTFKDYVNLPAVLHAMGVFVFVKYHTPAKEEFQKWITWLSGRTFGIYLIHMYMIGLLSKILRMDTTGIAWRTLGAVLVFVSSAIVIWIMQKIPVVKRIVP